MVAKGAFKTGSETVAGVRIFTVDAYATVQAFVVFAFVDFDAVVPQNGGPGRAIAAGEPNVGGRQVVAFYGVGAWRPQAGVGVGAFEAIARVTDVAIASGLTKLQVVGARSIFVTSRGFTGGGA